jgi:hypothetical protein
VAAPQLARSRATPSTLTAVTVESAHLTLCGTTTGATFLVATAEGAILARIRGFSSTWCNMRRRTNFENKGILFVLIIGTLMDSHWITCERFFFYLRECFSKIKEIKTNNQNNPNVPLALPIGLQLPEMISACPPFLYVNLD